ncbi:hypothetical protein ABTD81_09455 [Acinetobacter baumannii]
MFKQILKHRPKGATHWQAGYYYNSDECGIWSIWENGKWHGDFKFPDGVMTKLPEEKEPAMSEFKECTACNGRGEVGNILDGDTCSCCKGSGVELETLDKPENHISPNCKVEDV